MKHSLGWADARRVGAGRAGARTVRMGAAARGGAVRTGTITRRGVGAGSKRRTVVVRPDELALLERYAMVDEVAGRRVTMRRSGRGAMGIRVTVRRMYVLPEVAVRAGGNV